MIKLTPDIVFTQGSMTQALRTITGGEPVITVVQEKYADSNEVTRRYLECDRIWIRDVVITYKDQRLMSARTCVSEHAAQHNLNYLLTLGDKPLGDWLFAQDIKLIKRDIDSENARRVSLYEVLGEQLMIQEEFDFFRHSREGGNPGELQTLDSRLRGNDEA